MAQNVLATNLVVEQVEAEGGLRLRLAIELPLKVRIFQVLPGSSPITSPRPLRKRTRSQGPFLHRHYPASTVTMTLSDSRRGRRPTATLRPLPSPARVSPDYPHHLSDVPCPLPRRTETGASVDCFPAVRPSPKSRRVGIRNCHFRGLLRLHSRYGPPDRSAAQGGLCREASTRPVTRPSRSPATGPIDNYPGGTFLHMVIAPSGRTGVPWRRSCWRCAPGLAHWRRRFCAKRHSLPSFVQLRVHSVQLCVGLACFAAIRTVQPPGGPNSHRPRHRLTHQRCETKSARACGVSPHNHYIGPAAAPASPPPARSDGRRAAPSRPPRPVR